MKKIYSILILQLVTLGLFAQVDRSSAPKPATAREIKIGEYQNFTLKNGLQVFVVENHKLPRIQVSINLKNEGILEGEKAGNASIAGSLIGTGTTTRKKAQLDEEVDFIGASLSTSSNGISASSLSKHTNKLFDLVSDVLLNPSFERAELDKLKTQTLSGITASKDDPNSIASNVRGALVYGKGHPYGEITTEKTVGSITLEDTKAYYATYFKPSNAYLIIVGDIDLKSAKALTEKFFNKWPAGEVKLPTFAQPQAPAKTFVALVDRPASVQSVINIGYPVDLKPGPPDAIKSRILNQILGGGATGRLFLNLREKHGYTYGAYSSLSADVIIGNFNASASVRNEVTDSSVFEFVNELNKIAKEPVTEKELQDAKASIAGSFGRSLENPATVAGFALNTAKYNLPKDYYNNYLKAVDAVTVADVQATAKRFIRPDNAYIVVVGKGSDVADKLKKFGEVKYYDIEGNSYVPSKASALPAGLTAEKVIASYIDALGGLKKIQELKTLKMVLKGTVPGQGVELVQTTTKSSPNKVLQETSMGGNVMQKGVSNGKELVISAMGQNAPLDAATKEQGLFEAAILPEAVLSAFNVKLTLKGIETLDGKEAYVVEYTLPAGGKSTNYFDKASGLKLQEVKEQQGPQGTVSVPTKFDNYKEVNGVKFPHTTSVSFGPVSIKFEVTLLEVNPKVDDAIFKIQ